MQIVIVAVLLPLALGILVMTGLTSLFWLYEAVNTGHAGFLATRWRLSLPQAMVRLLLSSIRSHVLAYGLYPLGLFPALHRTEGESERPPVLFVHGLYHNASAWLLFRRWLARDGFTRTKALHYWSFGTDYFTILEKLARAVDALRAAHPGEPVVLVGHSLGGLLIRGYLSSPHCMDGETCKVAAAVTLGAPHGGSRLAALGIGRLARSLLYHGPLIRVLEARDQPPACPVLALTTPLDNFVLPADGSDIALPGWTLEAGAPVCHVGMIHHEPTARRTAQFLAGAVSSLPATSLP
ncbi:esterase/lipase family protein [Megalodesulfovibrio gigas]|uniref:Putative lipase class 2 n=1 Tax=Megalodesulfovibrio gigas (strain ATCC 19364 / DSM 1382 / NCIMB 9332 / VKM B-1759) TaxID=1121448 RepID=T2GFC5_MEGG1|nr:alpha/beta fold hydrolase [Megalodesulfovibrio gigas]AGW14592.1 putative lipase class 2 [Megalodesulfovibrio gigas DSM 1382 = ATCC 19364]